MKTTLQQQQQTAALNLEKQKLVVAARVRIHNNINYKIDDEDEASKQNRQKQQKDNQSISVSGTLKSKSNFQSTSQLSSASSITMKTGKTGVSQSKVGGDQQKKKKDESKVNIYACKMSEKNPLTNLVSLNQAPISYSLLSKYLKNDVNITQQKQTLYPKSRQYGFDIAFSQETSQEQIYSTLLKKKIKQTLNGFQTSIFIVGPENSGRKYTIRGDENIMNKSAQNERGLMVRACEDILSLIDISKESIRSRKAIVGGVYYNLGVQIYCVKDDTEVDLLVNAPEQLLNKEGQQDVEMGCFDITSTADLLVYYRQAQNRLNMIHDTLKGHDFKRNSTMFIRLLVLKNKQVYSSVNFAIFFEFDLVGQQKFYPVRDYLREVEKMQKRQLKTYQFNNRILHHLNLCFSSGPEYSAVLLGQFDSSPPKVENSQLLLQILSNLRTSKSTKTKGQNATGTLPANLKLNVGQSNEYEGHDEVEEDKEVQAFILNSNRKSQRSELNETAGFNMSENHDHEQQVNDFNPQSFKGSVHEDQGQEEGNQRVRQSQQSDHLNALEQGDSLEDTKKFNGKKFNTFGNETTYKNGQQIDENIHDDQQQFYDQSYQENDQFYQSQRLPQDVSSVVQDIFSYSDATKSMDENQKLQWVLMQERNLNLFKESISILKPPVKGSPEDLKFRKILEAKAFLANLKGELDLKEYVKKNLQDSPCEDDNGDAMSSSSGVDTRAYLNHERLNQRIKISNLQFRNNQNQTSSRQTNKILLKE